MGCVKWRLLTWRRPTWHLLAFVISCCVTDEVLGYTSKYRYQLLHPGRHTDDVIATSTANVVTSCARNCQSDFACVGFNYRAPVCELLSNVSDVSVAQDSADWKLYEGKLQTGSKFCYSQFYCDRFFKILKTEKLYFTTLYVT